MFYPFVKITIMIISAIFLVGCEETGTEATNVYNVSGTILQNNLPLSGASVSVDRKLNLTAYTDNSGYFMISGVPEGDHNLTAVKNYDDGSFTEKSAEISVYQDIVLNEIRLPNAVRLYAAERITDSSATLRWTSSDAIGFREYKIFRHITSGLDENTGTLVHVATVRTDTAFSDKTLEAYQDYYYRVYVMDDYGRLGGSNLISFKTPNKTIIQNGDFEIINTSTGLPEGWTFFVSSRLPVFRIDSMHVSSGRYSLLAELINGTYLDNMASQTFAPSELTAGERYTVSLDYKHDALPHPAYLAVFIRDNQHNYIYTYFIFQTTETGIDASDWKNFSGSFTAPSGAQVSNYTLTCHVFCDYRDIGDQIFHVWIDNVKLAKD